MRLGWDKIGERFFSTGVDHGVLFPMKNDGTYDKGVNWDGLTSVDESPEGGEPNDQYADNIKYLSLISAENFKYTIGAFDSPEEFDECDGEASMGNGVTVAQQTRRAFGFSYRTKIGNDIEGDDYGYVLHLVYNSKVSPSQKTNSTVNESPEAAELSWEASTTPVEIKAVNPKTGKVYKPAAHIMINSVKTNPAILKQIEDLLYGTDGEITYPEKTGLTADSYNEADPQGSEDPHDLGWLERTGTGTEQDPYVYAVTADTTVNNEKTYWILTAGDNPKTMGLYEKNESNKYVPTNDTSVQDGKTYYEQVETGGTDATLPSPDEIFALLNS